MPPLTVITTRGKGWEGPFLAKLSSTLDLFDLATMPEYLLIPC